MDREQRIAYVNAQVVCANAEIQGMLALNKQREDQGYSLAYGEEAFLNVPEKYGLTHNQIIPYLVEE